MNRADKKIYQERGCKTLFLHHLRPAQWQKEALPRKGGWKLAKHV
jgi:hypothetical protein